VRSGIIVVHPVTASPRADKHADMPQGLLFVHDWDHRPDSGFAARRRLVVATRTSPRVQLVSRTPNVASPAMLLNPAVVRVIPFAIYIACLMVESALSDTGIGFQVRWLYAVKVFSVAVALALLWKQYSELAAPRRVSSLDWALSIIAGVLIFVLWIWLDQPWAMFGTPVGWNPVGMDGERNAALIAARLAGAVIVVPVMEELFWRSLVMRWIRNHDFLSVIPRQVGAMGFFVSSALFAVEHHQWLAGLLAGFAYAGIYMRSNNLWTAVAAHAITNLLLGFWVLYTAQWHFW
jgi:CAAX prenyl protease-like protein